VPQMSYADAATAAICEEMRRDPRVFVMGQDVQTGAYGQLMAEVGAARVRNTPICETGFHGAAIGAALTGMRPVIEGAFSTFLYSAMDQIVSQAAKSRYMFGGQASIPIVVRSLVAYTIGAAAHHSDRPWGLFAQIPGVKIIVPATPYDVKGLLKSAIRDPNPVYCFDDYTLFGRQGDVPEHDYTVPIGVADIKRVGSDVTVVAIAGAVHHSLAAAELLASERISMEVIDVRTVAPLDRSTILQSARKTGRIVAVDPAPGTCSLASEVAATIAEHAFDCLKAPVIRLTAPDIPVPFSPVLEQLLYPGVDAIVAAVRRLCGSQTSSSTSHVVEMTRRARER